MFPSFPFTLNSITPSAFLPSFLTPRSVRTLYCGRFPLLFCFIPYCSFPSPYLFWASAILFFPKRDSNKFQGILFGSPFLLNCGTPTTLFLLPLSLCFILRSIPRLPKAISTSLVPTVPPFNSFSPSPAGGCTVFEIQDACPHWVSSD